MQYEQDPYNAYQNLLYKRAVIGLNYYSSREQAKMLPEQRKSIEKNYWKAQRHLNLWKQGIVNEISNNIFHIFHNSTIATALIENKSVDPKFKNIISFRDLGLGKAEIIDQLLIADVLPRNFHELTEAPTLN